MAFYPIRLQPIRFSSVPLFYVKNPRHRGETKRRPGSRAGAWKMRTQR